MRKLFVMTAQAARHDADGAPLLSPSPFRQTLQGMSRAFSRASAHCRFACCRFARRERIPISARSDTSWLLRAGRLSTFRSCSPTSAALPPLPNSSIPRTWRRDSIVSTSLLRGRFFAATAPSTSSSAIRSWHFSVRPLAAMIMPGERWQPRERSCALSPRRRRESV